MKKLSPRKRARIFLVLSIILFVSAIILFSKNDDSDIGTICFLLCFASLLTAVVNYIIAIVQKVRMRNQVTEEPLVPVQSSSIGSETKKLISSQPLDEMHLDFGIYPTVENTAIVHESEKIDQIPHDFMTLQRAREVIRMEEMRPGYARETYLARVDAMDGHEFEEFSADLLRRLGYTEVTVTQGSGDQGVDVLASREGIRYAIQCKDYTGKLGNKPVQEVFTGTKLYNCHVGVVLTNSYFTSGAEDAAKATGVLLWDRDKLAEMIEQAYAVVEAK